MVADVAVRCLQLSYGLSDPTSQCFWCPTQNTSSNHSPGRDDQYNENFHNCIGTCIVSQLVYRQPFWAHHKR